MGPRDLGQDALDAVYEALQVDRQWSVRDDRSFSWWGHRLRQRVWVDEPRESHGDRVYRLNAETALLEGLDTGAGTLKEISALNELADLSSLALESPSGRLLFHANAYLHAGNRWMLQEVKGAIALQAAHAHELSGHLQREIGGRVAESSHPESGPRGEPDNMLDVAAVFKEQGSAPTRFARGDFSEAAREASSFLVLATYDESSLSGEIAYRGRRPATVDHEIGDPQQRRALIEGYGQVAREKGETISAAHSVVWLAASASPQADADTALLQIRSREDHPALGSGLVCVLWVPERLSDDEAPRVANLLNIREATEWTEAHLLGSWCVRDGRLAFVSFLPNMLLATSDSSARRARLVNLIVSSAIRTQWAAGEMAASRRN